MNQLPTKLIELVLNNLNFQNKMKCRLVSKKFKSIVDDRLKFDQLIISFGPVLCNLYWFYTNKPERRDSTVYIYQHFIENDPFEKSIFGRIKKLKIGVAFDIEKTINKLSQLEELDILAKPIETGQINLPNLKILNFFCIFRKSGIRLNTPNLSIFKTYKIENFDFVYPEKIKYLELHDAYSCVEQFINLEYLLAYRYSRIQPEILNKLKKLKEIHQFYNSDLSHLQQINAEKERLKLKSLKLFICGLEFNFYQNKINNDVPNIEYNFDYHTRMMLENYSKSANVLPYIVSINYNDLLKVFKEPRQIPSDLHFKLPNIHTVLCNDTIEDIDHFFKFLSNLQTLSHLYLNYKSLTDQHHYDQLPQLLPSLIRLSLDNANKLVEIDFNFILRFEHLVYLIIDKKLDKQFIKTLFTDLKYLKDVRFIYQGIKRSVFKTYHEEHFIFEFGKQNDNGSFTTFTTEFTFNCLNDFIDHLEE